MTDARPDRERFPGWLESLVDHQFLLGARRWAGLTIGPYVLTASAGLLTLLGTTLLFRAMAPHDAGHFALALALLEILTLVGSLGFPSIITRLYSGATRDAFDWPMDLAGTALYAVVPLTAGVALLPAIYSLPPAVGVFLMLAAPLLVILESGCHMLNAHGYYGWSSLVRRFPNALLVIPGALSLLGQKGTSLSPLLIAYLAGMLATAGGLLVLLARNLQRGSRRVSWPERMEGNVFLVSVATTYLPDQGVTALAGALLPPEQLAVYAAMAVFARPFKLGASILSMIMTPELVRRRRERHRNLMGGIWALAIIGAAFMALAAPALARWAYQGRYDDGLRLLPLLACAGALQLTVVPPKSELAGRAPMALLKRLVLLLAAGLGLIAGGSAMLVSRFGAGGVAAAALCLQLGRNLISYHFWRRYRRAQTLKDGAVNL